MKQSPPFISKSEHLAGLQCVKLLWYSYNGRDQIPAYGAQTQAIFDQGHLVGLPRQSRGELAKEAPFGFGRGFFFFIDLPQICGRLNFAAPARLVLSVFEFVSQQEPPHARPCNGCPEARGLSR